jgi:class 3 adenylate cyclase/tetratricopeptide (TPR) repeat protein
VFVGRAAELEWLRGCLETAVAGHPRVALVVGEPGIGKTRLLRELQGTASSRGIAVGIGRGFEDLGIPFLPIAEALAPEVHAMSAAVARTLGIDAEIVRRLVRGEVTTAEHSSHRPWQPDDSRLFLAASRAVIEIARTKPLLLMLDDVHWFDQASLELFGHVVLGIADVAGRHPLHLLIVGSTRPVEPSHRLARLLARFQRDDICETLELSGLAEGDVTQLVQGLGLNRPSHQLIAVVNDATQGNPLFVQEVVDHLRRHGALRSQGGHLTTTASATDVPLPLDVTTAIASRLDALDAETRRLLTIAACCGGSIDPAVLAAVADTTSATVVETLERATGHRLVVGDGRTFQFAHPLVRRTLEASPSATQRQRLHATIASALRAHYHAPTPDHDMEIAHHLVAAGPAAEPNLLVAYARRAGQLAFARASWSDAARFFEAALAGGATMLGTRECAELHRLAGLAYFRDQDAGPCLDHYEHAIQGFSEVDDPSGLARSLMGRTRAQFTLASVSYGTLIDPTPLVAVAERLLPSEPVLAGFVWSEIAQVYWTARQPAAARQFAERALDVSRNLGEEVLAAEAHRALALVAGQELDPAGGLSHLEDGLAAARRAGDRWLESQLLQRLPLALVWHGRFDDVDRTTHEGAALTDVLHDWGDRSLAEGALVGVAVARGDFEAAERHAHHTMALIQRSGYPWAGPTALPALACARWYRGAWHDAEDALEILGEPGQVFDEPGPALQFMLFLLRHTIRAWTDDPATLRAEYNERIVPLAASVSAPEAADAYGIGLCGAVVDMAERVGSPAMAGSVYDQLARAEERGLLVSSGWVCLVARALGTAATLLRQWDRAARWFDTALAQATMRGMRPEIARTHLGIARLLVARGRAADRARAPRHVGEALSLFQQLGATPFLDEARTLAEMLDAPTGSSSRRLKASAGVTRREESILRHLGRGHDDRAIARDLVLRPATLARDLRALLRKLGVTSRGAAAAYAREHGFAPEPPPLRESRTITILFTDVKGSTTLFERLGDVAARDLLRVHDETVRDALARRGGTEIKHTGDGIMATFPSVALGLACAIEVQRAIAAHNAHAPQRFLGVRIGLNAGEPVSEAGDVFGAAVGAAARICNRASPGQILVSDVVRHLATGQDLRFVDRGQTKLRGFARRFRLFEVPW